MATVGSVRIGTKNIEIQAFTGEVSNTSTSHYNKFLIANGAGGQHSIEVSERVISIARGQKVTGFWGVVRGMDSDWLALFNHDTGKWAWFTPTRNTLAGPPMNQLLSVAAVFTGLFGAMALFGGSAGPGFVVLAISALILWRVQRRRKVLMHAVNGALTTVRMEA